MKNFLAFSVPAAAAALASTFQQLFPDAPKWLLLVVLVVSAGLGGATAKKANKALDNRK